MTARRQASSLNTARSGTPAQRYCAPLTAAAAAKNSLHAKTVAAGAQHQEVRHAARRVGRAFGFGQHDERLAGDECMSHRDDSPPSEQDDDHECAQGDIRVDEPRLKRHQAPAHLVDQDEQDQHRGQGKKHRQATPARVELPEAGPQERQ